MDSARPCQTYIVSLDRIFLKILPLLWQFPNIRELYGAPNILRTPYSATMICNAKLVYNGDASVCHNLLTDVIVHQKQPIRAPIIDANFRELEVWGMAGAVHPMHELTLLRKGLKEVHIVRCRKRKLMRWPSPEAV